MKITKLLLKIKNCCIILLLTIIFCFSGFYNSVSKAEPITHVSEKSPSYYDNTGADNFISAAVVRTGPAVVRIDTETVVTRQLNPFFDDPLFRDFFQHQLRPPIPQERRITGQGSGFIIDKGGIILTNAHVVSNADKVTVTLKDGRTFNGKVKGTDEVTDLSLIHI